MFFARDINMVFYNEFQETVSVVTFRFRDDFHMEKKINSAPEYII